MTARDFQLTRKTLHKSQSELANLMGLSVRTVQSYEQGARIIPAHVQQLLYLMVSRLSRGTRGRRSPCWQVRGCDPATKARCVAYLCKAEDICWLVTGTLCHGKPVGTMEAKLRECQKCAVIRRLQTT